MRSSSRHVSDKHSASGRALKLARLETGEVAVTGRLEVIELVTPDSRALKADVPRRGRGQHVGVVGTS